MREYARGVPLMLQRRRPRGRHGKADCFRVERQREPARATAELMLLLLMMVDPVQLGAPKLQWRSVIR